MPEHHWPNTELHLFQDRYGSWRARIAIRMGGRERIFYVPARSEGGATSRLELFLRLESTLDDVGVLYGLKPLGSDMLELRRVCEQRDQALAKAEVFRAERDALERQITIARERVEALRRSQ